MNVQNIYKDTQVKELKELVKMLTTIGRNLSSKKDMNSILDLILVECMKITSSDAGSIYIREENEKKDMLRFKVTRNNSKNFPFNEFLLPVNDKSIAGYSAFSGNAYTFDSMDEVFSKIGIHYNDSFDKSYGYKTQNMLVVPMKNIKDEVTGVVQLINKKIDYDIVLDKIPDDYTAYTTNYNTDEAEIIASLSSQAAILIERTNLYKEIEKLFETFIESLVTALDRRDPVTAGHSMRVTSYAMELLKKVDQINYGSFKDFSASEDDLKEMYYSGLLHDIGKIGVKEYVLTKQNKLTDHNLNSLKYRFAFIKKSLETKSNYETLSKEEFELIENLDSHFEFIKNLNKTGFMKDEDFELLKKIKQMTFEDIDGSISSLITEDEFTNLSVKRGNLTQEERKMIESHVAHTFNILKEISWGSTFSAVPMIASSHHEKLDGSGYPKNLNESDIPLKSKMLAVADIFDALTAKDRPYKPALPLDKTIRILNEEAERNHLDKELVDIFINEEVYKPIYESK